MTIRKFADLIRISTTGVIRGQFGMKSFQEIEKERRLAGLTRKAVYERAGLHKETWRRTAKGTTEPNTGTLNKLASAVEQLVKEKEASDA